MHQLPAAVEQHDRMQAGRAELGVDACVAVAAGQLGASVGGQALALGEDVPLLLPNLAP